MIDTIDLKSLKLTIGICRPKLELEPLVGLSVYNLYK